MEAFKQSITLSYFFIASWAYAGTSGEIRIDVDDIKIGADHLIFKEPYAHISGNVRVTGEHFYARCEDLECNIRTQDMHTKGIDVGIDRGYILSAKEAFFSRERIILSDADMGFSVGGSMTPHMRAKRIIYDPKRGKGVAQSAYLKMGNVPLPVPSLTVGDWVRSVDMRWDAGHTAKLGYYVQGEMTYNVYEDLHLGGLLNAYGKRGVLMGPVVKVGGEGELRVGYIIDRGERGVDIGKKRWVIAGEQHHHFGQNIDILSDFLWASDGQMGEDFHLDWAKDSDVRDSFGEFDYRGENDLWTIFTRVRMNRYQHFPERVPSLRFERFPREINDSGIYYFGYVDYTRQRSAVESGQAIEQNRIDSYWGINRPVAFERGIYFTPLIGGRLTHYGEGGDRFLGELGLDWEANFYAHYFSPISWLRAKEWRHTVRPIARYRHTGKFGKGYGVIETRERNEFLPTIDLAEMRNGDDLEAQDILRLGLEHDFFGKGERGKIRKIAALDFYQDLRFKRNIGVDRRKEAMFSDCYILSELNPRRWLNLSLYARLNGEHFRLQEVNGEVKFLSGDLWELGLRVKDLRHRVNQFGIHFRFRFDEISRFDIEAQIDGRSGKFLATKISYATRWSHVWNVKFFCKIENHSGRKERFQPGFLIDLARW
ncbi:MAG: hypothetical protein LBB05_01285 [Puniceicoccales bacterium]|nr:hypothetical protein [Puniceicoccales bacterium]